MGWIIWFVIISLAGGWLGFVAAVAFVLWRNRTPFRDFLDVRWDGDCFYIEGRLRPPKDGP
ncbi:MAG TPA: hypothetical protein VMY35_10590 [Phycisphaerae bacterium]|nr:hypothetical protein [Phycisphaerae bacterium]